MGFKVVGVDDTTSLFPTRVVNALKALFEPSGLSTATSTALAATYFPKWQPSTTYAQGQLVVWPDGSTQQAISAHTSGSGAPTSANWTPVVNTTTTLAATYSTLLSPASTYTWNSDGTIATETVAGSTTNYGWNSDGTLHSETRGAFTRIYSYNIDGTLAGIA